MHKNLFGFFGSRWIDEYTLNELKNLAPCYIVEVTTRDSIHPINIADITGTERNIYYIQIYYLDKAKDKSPYCFSVEKYVDTYLLADFRRDCENRKRTKEMAEFTVTMLSESETQELRKKLKKRMFEVFKVKYESGAEFAGNDFLCHRNQYKRLGLRKMLEFIRQDDEYGIDIIISFDIENASASQMERTLNDLELIDATVENEPLP